MMSDTSIGLAIERAVERAVAEERKAILEIVDDVSHVFPDAYDEWKEACAEIRNKIKERMEK